MHIPRYAIVSSLWMLSSLHGAVVTFTDSTFLDANWNESTLADSTTLAATSSTQKLSGGNPERTGKPHTTLPQMVAHLHTVISFTTI